MRRALLAIASSLAAGCGAAPAPVFVCVRLGEVVYRGPAPGASVADDGLLLRAPDGRWLFVEADRCWPVGPAR